MFVEHKTLKYPTNEYSLRSFSVARGLNQVTTDAIVIGKLPRLIIIGITSADAFSGVLNKSPFNFKTKNLKELSVSWNDQNVEHRVFPFSFRDTTANTGYSNFMQGLRSIRKTAASELLSNGINKDNYLNGNGKY